MKNRHRTVIIGVQGTLQLLAAMTAVKHREKQFPDVTSHYILVVYDLFSKERDTAFVKAIFDLSSLWNFDDKVFLDNPTMRRVIRGFNTRRKKIDLLHQMIGVSEIDEVYLCRNYIGSVSSFILNAYPNSVKITYGDGYGTVSHKKFFEKLRYRNKNIIRQGIHNCKKNCKQAVFFILGWEFKTIEFDMALLSIPVDYCGGYLRSIPHEFIPLDILHGVLDQAKKAVQDIYGDYVKEKIGSQIVDLLLLTSTFSEAKYSSEEKEVNLYISRVLDSVSSGSLVVIKEHPRNSSNVSNMLKDKLVDLGFKVYCFNDQDFNFIPIELSIGLIKPKIVVSFVSTAATALALFENVKHLSIHPEQVLRDFLSPESVDSMIDYQIILADSLTRINEGWLGGQEIWSRSMD